MLMFGFTILVILGLIIIFFYVIELKRQLVKNKRKKSRKSNNKIQYRSLNNNQKFVQNNKNKLPRETNKRVFKEENKVLVNRFEDPVLNNTNDYTSDTTKSSEFTKNDENVTKGEEGESLIFQELKKLNQRVKLLRNIYLPTEDDSTTEVDLVMIDQTGFYVIESKNYSGWIFGSENHKEWTQTFPNKSKFKFPNPIRQNYGHIKNLQYITQITDDSFFYSYIVFGNEATLKKVKNSSSRDVIIKREYLCNELRRGIKSREKVFTQIQVEELYEVLFNYTNEDDYIKRIHVKNVMNKHGR